MPLRFALKAWSRNEREYLERTVCVWEMLSRAVGVSSLVKSTQQRRVVCRVSFDIVPEITGSFRQVRQELVVTEAYAGAPVFAGETAQHAPCCSLLWMSLPRL